MTEEYDEDSPFSRPPNWEPNPSKQEAAALAQDQKADSASHSATTQSATPSGQTSSDHRNTGNGNAPASVSESNFGTAKTTPPVLDAAQAQCSTRALAEAEEEKSPSVGRGQVYSDADTPERLPAGIEFADQPDSDQPSTTAVMDTVHQKPGLRRTLDGKGHVAPDRDSEELGLPPPQSQAQQGDPSIDSSQGDGSGQGVAWWDSAAVSLSGAVETVKAALSAGYESFSKGQSSGQQPGDWHAPVSNVLLLHGSACQTQS